MLDFSLGIFEAVNFAGFGMNVSNALQALDSIYVTSLGDAGFEPATPSLSSGFNPFSLYRLWNTIC